MHQLHNGISGVKLEQTFGKIGVVWLFVMIILEQFTHHQEIKRQRIFAVVVVVKIGVAVLVAAPVYDSTVYRAHQEVNWQ